MIDGKYRWSYNGFKFNEYSDSKLDEIMYINFHALIRCMLNIKILYMHTHAL